MTLRLVFMGTPDFAVPTLDALAEAGHDIAAVYTRAPAASGRGLASRPSPVQAAAERRGIAVRTPRSLRSEEEAAALTALAPDLAVVVAYGLLLPPAILTIPRHGCLNLHASLLPRWRGAAPIHRAVMAGDTETGIAVMRMEEGLDTGPIGLEARLAIGPNATTGEMHDALAVRGAALMLEALAALEAGTLRFRPQSPDPSPAGEGSGPVTYARKLGNEESRIVWDAPASAVHDQIRGLSPWPGAFFEADLGRGPERIKVLRAQLVEGAGPSGTLLDDGRVACRDGALQLLRVQRAGKAPAAWGDFARGARLAPDARLG